MNFIKIKIDKKINQLIKYFRESFAKLYTK